MMVNKILIDSNRLTNYEDDKILIRDKMICFKSSSEYEVIYSNTDKIDIEYVLLDDIEVSIYEYLASDKIIDSKIVYNIGKDSSFNITRFMITRSLNEVVDINLGKVNAKINYRYSSLAHENEEHHIVINHYASKTESSIINRVLTNRKASVHFTIDSKQDGDCYDCKMNQETKIITDNVSNCLIKPNMYINNDEIEARHASYIGKFNDEELFYLMSKGLSKREARKLLAKGFIYANVNIPSVEENIIRDINEYWR